MSASPAEAAEASDAMVVPDPPKTPERKAPLEAPHAATPKASPTPRKSPKTWKKPAASCKAKAKAKASPSVQKKAKTEANQKSSPKGKAKAKASIKAKKNEDDKDDKDKKDPQKEKDQQKDQQKKKGKESVKDQTSKWVRNLEKRSDDEEKDDASKERPEERDRQKAQKFRKLEKAGALPAEVKEAFDAAEKSENPRANKTQLINSLFRKEGNNFVMVPKDPAFKRVQKLLDVKYGAEESQSYLDATGQITR